MSLRLLTSHRLDVIHDRVRAINRLRATLLEYFPALERSFDYSKNKAALTMLTHYATPDSLRHVGVTRLASWLKARGCRNSATVAATAVDAARAQSTTLPAQEAASRLVAKLASVAGLAPVPRDSGRVSGNLHRPHRFNRRLLRTCYLAALSSLKSSPSSRAFYDRKRAEGKSHKQALIALARRRMNVIWAMLRDHAPYVEPAVTMPLTA